MHTLSRNCNAQKRTLAIMLPGSEGHCVIVQGRCPGTEPARGRSLEVRQDLTMQDISDQLWNRNSSKNTIDALCTGKYHAFFFTPKQGAGATNKMHTMSCICKDVFFQVKLKENRRITINVTRHKQTVHRICADTCHQAEHSQARELMAERC